MEIQFFTSIAISAILWGIVWLERDISHRKEEEKFAWLRSYALIWMLWAMAANADIIFKTWVLFSISTLSIIWILLAIAYSYSTFKNKDVWVTSELAAIMTFFIWVISAIWLTKSAIIWAISLTLVISLKEKAQKFKNSISKEEFMHTLKFAAIAFVILPLLPDAKFSINDLLLSVHLSSSALNFPIFAMKFLNPYSVWFFVVVMSAVWYVWYILSKLFWKDSSVILSSIIWWLVSSTAVTATMSEQSKKDPKNPYIYVLGVLSANIVMLIRVLCIVIVLNPNLIKNIMFPSMLMLIWFVVVMMYSYHESKENIKKTKVKVEEKVESPFSIAPAIKFWLFILFIKFIAWIWILYKDVFLWDFFYYIFWIISWFADVDAITQTMSNDSKDMLILPTLASSTILLAVMSNNIVKASMAYRFWNKSFWKKVAFAFWISMLLGLLGLVLN